MIKKLKEKLKTNQGITLIALVITIIVLLILAGVSIAMLTGENGILKRTEESKILTNISKIEEQAKLKITELKIDNSNINGIAEDLIETGDLKRIIRQEDDGKTYMYYIVQTGKLKNENKNQDIVNARNVYGLNEDLTGYYIDTNGKIYGKGISKIELKDDKIIKFASEEIKTITQNSLGITSDEITFGELKRVDKLTISGKDITDLSDLQFFLGLKELILEKLTLNSLEGLENCSQLTTLKATSCSSKSYEELEYLTNLEICHWISDTTFDFDRFIVAIANLPQITNLRLAGLELTSIEKLSEIQSITKITTLQLDSNQIRDISVIENFVALQSLSLQNNKINDISPIKILTNLNNLYLANNYISDVSSISSLVNLKRLDLNQNENIDINSLNKIAEIINKLNYFSIDIKYVDKISNLKQLILNYSDLDNEDMKIIKNATSLQKLSIAGNKNITDATPLANLTNLTYLDIQGTGITDIKPLEALKKLTTLSLKKLDQVNLKDIESIIHNITALSVSDKALESIVDCNNITVLNLTWSELTKIPDLSKLNMLEELNLSYNNISDLSVISKLTNLKSLNLTNVNSGNKINMPDLNKLTKLETLHLDNNYITSEDLINISSLKNIKSLFLQNNSIRSVNNLKNLVTLENLYLTGNLIRDFTPLNVLVKCNINKGTQR